MVTFVGRAPIAVPGGPVYTPPDVGGDAGDAPAVTVESAATTIAGLQSDINAAPDGSVIGLVAASTITGNAAAQLHLDGRNALSIVMRGATIQRTAAGTTPLVLIDGAGTNISLFNGTIDGSKSSSLGKWDEDFEAEHGISLGGIVNFEASGITVRDVGGDGLHIDGGADVWSENVRFHHGVFYNIGRMGVAITDGGRSVVIDFNTISEIGYYTFDIEPNGATVADIAAGAINVRFSDNAIGTKPYGDYPGDGSQALGLLLALTGASGTGPAKQVSLLRNTMSDQAMRVGVFDNGVDTADFAMQYNIASDTFTATGDIAKCVSVDGCAGVTVTNNTQPCTVDADFVTTSGSSGSITSTPNTV